MSERLPRVGIEIEDGRAAVGPLHHPLFLVVGAPAREAGHLVSRVRLAILVAGRLLVGAVGGSWARRTVRGAVAVVAACSAATLGVLPAGESGVSTPAPAPSAQGLSALPPAARGPVSAAMGSATRSYGVLGLRAVNPAQRLRLSFSPTGVRVASGSGHVRLSLVGFGREGALRVVGTSQPVAHGNRVRYRRAGLIEWYANGPLGLEQGFTVARRPRAGGGPLMLALALAGNLRARLDRGEVSLSDAGALLRYGGLWAADARGRTLPSWLSVRAGGVSIGVDDRGAVYPLRIDPFVQQGSKLVGSDVTGAAEQGGSVALSRNGNTALVGGPDDLAGGAAWVFTRSGSTWTQQGPKLTAFDAAGNAGFGYSVALSADGNTALIGGPYDNSSSDSSCGRYRIYCVGAAWVFTRSGSTWTQQGPKLLGAGEIGNANFGWSVALSADGNAALIGGPADNFVLRSGRWGATWVFTHSGSSWTQQAKLVASDGSFAQQGTSVALSGDGNTALIGGPYDHGIGGAAFVFSRTGTAWSEAGSKFYPGGNAGAPYFGSSVALSADGSTALISSRAANSYNGGAWVYVPYNAARTLWVGQGPALGPGSSVALSGDGNNAVLGNGNPDFGAGGSASVFARSPATPVSPPTWSQQGSTLVGSGQSGRAAQGASVALSADGSTALIGGPGDNNNVGAVWVFSSGLGSTPLGRPRLHLVLAGPRSVSAGRFARYRIAVRVTEPHNVRVHRLKNVQIVSTRAGHRVGRWRLRTLAPGRTRTLHLRVRVPAGAHGSFCITTRARARNAREAIVRHCTPIRGT